jgi:hypothetical protein
MIVVDYFKEMVDLIPPKKTDTIQHNLVVFL